MVRQRVLPDISGRQALALPLAWQSSRTKYQPKELSLLEEDLTLHAPSNRSYLLCTAPQGGHMDSDTEQAVDAWDEAPILETYCMAVDNTKSSGQPAGEEV